MTKSLQLSSKLRFIILATFIGNTLQWFDYSLFGMLLPILKEILLPQLSYTFFFILLTLGSFARLIGGMMFGYLGDTTGRKKALITAILFMTLPVLFIGLLPTYSQIGIAAGICLGIFYLFQGFCVGGEFPGSIVFLIESAPPEKRNVIGIWSYVGVVFGMLFVSFNLIAMKQLLSHIELLLWGWRLPFLLGAFVGVIGLYMRTLLRETPLFQEAKTQGILTRTPLRTIFRDYKMILFNGIGFYILDIFCFKFFVIYSNYYFKEHLGIHEKKTLAINLYPVLLLFILLPLMAKLGNRIGNIRLAKGAAVGLLLFVLPLYALMELKSLPYLYLSQLLLTLLMSGYASNMPALLFTLFPISVRYTGVALTINITVALFGGAALLLANWLLLSTQAANIPAFFIMGAALLALISLSRYRLKHTETT